MLVALVIIWICVFSVWYYLGRRRLLRVASKIPGPPGYPIIGNALTLWGKPEDVFKRMRNILYQYPRLAGFWIGPKLHVALFDPRDVEVVLKSRAIQKAEEYRFLKPWLGDSILLSTGAKFKQNKKLIIPSFHINNLKCFISVFHEHAMSLVEKLEQLNENEELNMHNHFSKITMDALLETMLGIRKETLGKEVLSYATAIDKLCRLIHMRVYKFWLRPDIIFRFSSLRKEQNKYLDVVHSLTERVIKQRKIDNEWQIKDDTHNCFKEEKQWKVFVDDLLQVRDENGVGLTDEEVKDEVITMMFAGQETTSSTLGFVMSLLGVYQEIQDKVVIELREIFGDSMRPITYEDIQSLRYLEQVIQETWRLYPPVPLVAKQSLEDIALEECIIPAHTTIGIMIMAIHRNSSYYKCPDRFNPDNFSPETAKNRNPYSYMPFSAGTRMCIGPKYAMLLVKVILSTILRSYRVHSRWRERDFVLAGQTILKRREGFPIILERREQGRRNVVEAA